MRSYSRAGGALMLIRKWPSGLLVVMDATRPELNAMIGMPTGAPVVSTTEPSMQAVWALRHRVMARNKQKMAIDRMYSSAEENCNLITASLLRTRLDRPHALIFLR